MKVEITKTDTFSTIKILELYEEEEDKLVSLMNNVSSDYGIFSEWVYGEDYMGYWVKVNNFVLDYNQEFEYKVKELKSKRKIKE